MSYQNLLQKIEKHQALVGIIGMGYVGLPLLQTFIRGGHPCLGYDIDSDKIRLLKAGRSYIEHIPNAAIAECVRSDRFRASANPRDLRSCDALIICVPTPLTVNREPDMTYVIKTAETIRDQLRKDQLIVLESTTYPGTTREVLQPILEETGLQAGRDFYLAFSPEREDPGRQDYSTATIPKVVGGLEARSGRLAVALYEHAVKKVVSVKSCEVAEACKILENVYRSVNIALVNELKMLFDRMGIDVWEVIDAASTKPFGYQPFYPGPGLGGHCIPIDPFYLTWKARQYEFTTRFIELAGEINTAMPRYVVQRTAEALNEHSQALKGSRILILGLSYKADIDDVRESPSLELIELFRERGAKVDYNDPHVPRTHKMREYDLKMTSKKLSAAMLRGYHAVVISTAHKTYDWEMITSHARLIIDTRNATKNIRKNRSRIVKA
ncbi:MAG: UDP-N-acetyl-D-glucosamine 6-dehydrogenase [Phycisphaerae bacterium]|nr:UDP-N-acetyl-D-glucosamine 6-dehydrogenase [Phycisphaerae bacterium]